MCWLAVVLAVVAAGGVGRAQIFTRTDPEAEVRLGRAVAAEIERIVGLSTDPTVVNRVARIGQRVAEALEVKGYTYEFRVLAWEEINGLSLPGGIVFLTEGLVGHIPSDEALAFVIAHEIAHAAKRHWASWVKKSEGLGLLTGLLGLAVGGAAGDAVGSVAADLAYALMEASYSRDQEREADAVGLELMWRAHFDPKGGIEAMEMLRRVGEGAKVPKYLRSHPPVDERMSRLKKLAAELAGKERPPLAGVDQTALSADRLLPSLGDMTGIDPAPSDWYPLAVGNEWRYEVASAGGLRTTYTLRISSAIPGPAGTVYRMEWVPEKGQARCSQVVTTSSAVWLRPRPEAPDSVWTLDLLLPPVPEEAVTEGAWSYCAAGTETVSIPCGRFEATVVKKWGGDPVRTYLIWLAPGVGMVKRVCQEQNVTETLISYRVRPPAAASPEEGTASGGGEQAAESDTTAPGEQQQPSGESGPQAPPGESGAQEPPGESGASQPPVTGGDS